MPDHYGEGKKGGKKKLGEKSKMKKLSASGESVGSLEARRTPSMDIPAAPSPASVSRSGLEGIDFNALNRDLAKTAASIRSLTSTSRPRKSASAELSRTSAPTSRASSAPRGPQVSMPMRSPAPRMSSMYTGASRVSTPARTSPAPARASTPAPTRAATPKAPTRAYGEGRNLSRTEIDSAMARQYGTSVAKAYRPTSTPKKADKSPARATPQRANTSNAPMRRTAQNDFASLGSSFYSGLSRGK